VQFLLLLKSLCRPEINMPWLSQESYPLPEEDIVSFAFGNTGYDNNTPVTYCYLGFRATLTVYRFIMMLRTSRELFHGRRV
jgi:hypothetical protein